MHVLHVIDALGLGGAERMAVDLANEGIRRGHRVSLCITRSNDVLVSELHKDVRVLKLDRRSTFETGPLLKLRSFIRESAVDLCHVHMRSSMALVLMMRALRLIRTPMVLHDHFGGIERDQSIPHWFRLARLWIDQYVGVSPLLGSWARVAGVPDSKISVIENALDLQRLQVESAADLRSELKLQREARIALVVATVRRDKGLEVAIEAVASPALASLHLVVAGTLGDATYLDELKSCATRFGVSNRVHFLGGRRDVPRLIAASDLAVSASHTESGPLVLIEFAVGNKPFVATLVGDIARRMNEASVPEFVPPGNAAEMALAIERVLSEDSVHREHRGTATRAVLRTFDIREIFPRWEKVYTRARGRS